MTVNVDLDNKLGTVTKSKKNIINFQFSLLMEETLL